MNTVKCIEYLRLLNRQSYLSFKLNKNSCKKTVEIFHSSIEHVFVCSKRNYHKDLNISCWRSGQQPLLSNIYGKNVEWNHPYHLIARNSLYQSSLRLDIAKPSKEQDNKEFDLESDVKKLGLVQRYKKMLKEYWYVLIPVHLVTSSIWFGSFYYLAKSGIDIVPFLKALGVGDTFLEPLKKSSLGYIALASAMYKLATPARYMITLGGTTFSIKYLTKRGLIKPMPSHKEIKTMIQQRRQGS